MCHSRYCQNARRVYLSYTHDVTKTTHRATNDHHSDHHFCNDHHSVFVTKVAVTSEKVLSYFGELPSPDAGSPIFLSGKSALREIYCATVGGENHDGRPLRCDACNNGLASRAVLRAQESSKEKGGKAAAKREACAEAASRAATDGANSRGPQNAHVFDHTARTRREPKAIYIRTELTLTRAPSSVRRRSLPLQEDIPPGTKVRKIKDGEVLDLTENAQKEQDKKWGPDVSATALSSAHVSCPLHFLPRALHMSVAARCTHCCTVYALLHGVRRWSACLMPS